MTKPALLALLLAGRAFAYTPYPTPTKSPTPRATPTWTAAITPTPTPIATATPSPTPTFTVTGGPTSAPSPSASPSPTPSSVPTPGTQVLKWRITYQCRPPYKACQRDGWTQIVNYSVMNPDYPGVTATIEIVP